MEQKFATLQSELALIAKDVKRMEQRAWKQEQVCEPPPPTAERRALLPHVLFENYEGGECVGRLVLV